MYDTRSVECGEKDLDSCSTTSSTVSISSSSESMSLKIRRRRLFQRQACILSVMAAFALGLMLGVLLPFFGVGTALHFFITANSTTTTTTATTTQPLLMRTAQNEPPSAPQNTFVDVSAKENKNFPTIYDVQSNTNNNPNAVSFLPDERLPAESVFRNAFYLEENKDTDTMTVKKLDASDGTIKEFTVQRTADGLFRKSAEIRLSKPTPVEEILLRYQNDKHTNKLVPTVDFVEYGSDKTQHSGDYSQAIIEKDIYWGEAVENAIPKGFSKQDTDHWNEYLQNGVIVKMEIGCGRMQNRMVTFQDGTKACARYRQNTDQIQGELFSFYLGQLLNISNMAPSGASIVDLNSNTWQLAASDIETAQWKSFKPVVLTKWLPDLEAAGIPQPFQPLERHLNKLDIKNITGAAAGLNEGLSHLDLVKKSVLQRLVELAQWSDLIVFDYLIANLDRVVNNLYNYQWNAEIMAAPAHNLARQKDTQLLVFLDNESGLLHGYRLLKKYEAYHGLLLDNLCVFRKSTIKSLQSLRDNGVGRRLQRLFETTTRATVRDVLPPLPDKSIKILNDRIDRVLGQVQKCRELFSNR